MGESSDEEALRGLVKQYADSVEYEMALYYSEQLVVLLISVEL